MVRRTGQTLSAQAKRVAAVKIEPVDWKIKPGHPRLMLPGDEWASAIKRGPDDPRLARMIARAAYLKKQPLVEYDSKKLLVRSREALRRIPTYAGLWRLTGNDAYAQDAKRELLNVCSFPDWQPDNFLSTAEMMNAVAIGYDWLYDTLSPKERRTVARAIIDYGLEPAMEAYTSSGGWTRAPHNWNLVCNGAVIVAALAVIDDDPEMARKVLALAMRSMKSGLATFDLCRGGWPEGPMYHNYATRYAIFAAAALESAPVKAVELPSKSLRNAGFYRIYLTGPTGKSFNFGDSDETIGNSAWLNWLGRRYDARYTAFQSTITQDEPSIFDLLWSDDVKEDFKQLPLVRSFPVCEVVALRSGWGQDDTFLALKGGDSAFNHTHLDHGTFVLDMLGQRFAGELGADNYDLPGYLGPRRADYLRSSTAGQNTLVIGDASQPLDARSRITRVDEEERTVRLDLTGAYPGTRSVTRSAAIKHDTVTLTDEIELDESASIIWHMHTSAEVKIDGQRVLLTSSGKTVELLVLSPKRAQIEAVRDRTRPPALPIEGMTDLRIIIPRAKSALIDLRFLPVKE
ncbi:MAG: heparinase II/III family protein [Burkholderiales bacterium]|nr:heparinase II/III family protein [Phycisphaerae bacterium]